MKVEGFGLFSVEDPVDRTFDCNICWSRLYEYPHAIALSRGVVHNTSWGFEGVHVTFRNELDRRFHRVVHSDLRPAEGAHVWDITTPPPLEWLGRFDTVLSISTLEEVKADHVQVMRDNMLPQLRPGGRLVVTFDVPGFQVAEVEDWLGVEIHIPDTPLTIRNSVRPGPRRWPDLKVGYLTIKEV